MIEDSTDIKDEALLFAVTPVGRCVGIRIFPQKTVKIEEKEEEKINNYIEERLKNAINLKNQIESGYMDSKCSEIVNDLPASWSGNVEKIILSQRQWIQERDVLKVEKHLVDLNATLEHAMQPNKHNFRICFVVISEMNDLIVRNKMTPLMLKKHLTIVENIEKLTRFSLPEFSTVQKNVFSSHSCSIVRNIASITMKRLKRLLNFIGNDKQFLQHMEEWSELLNQLTNHMTDEDKRNLIIDPALNMPSPLPNT